MRTLREWDRRAAEELGLPGLLLMEGAGTGAAHRIEELCLLEPAAFPEPLRVFCGPGKNGGDGFVVARHLFNAGFAVEVEVLGDPSYPIGSDTQVNFAIVARMGVPLGLHSLDKLPGSLFPLGVPRRATQIDALFGTGLSRPLCSPYLECVEAMNRSGNATLSLDVPSGLDADTGVVLGAAVRASHTLTFAASKLGFERGDGPDHCGRIHVIDIGLPRILWATPGCTNG